MIHPSCLPWCPTPSDKGKLGSSGSPGRQTPTALESESSSAGCFPSVRNLMQKDKLERSVEESDIPICAAALLQKERWKAAPHLTTAPPQSHLTKSLVVSILSGKVGCLKTHFKDEIASITFWKVLCMTDKGWRAERVPLHAATFSVLGIAGVPDAVTVC